VGHRLPKGRVSGALGTVFCSESMSLSPGPTIAKERAQGTSLEPQWLFSCHHKTLQGETLLPWLSPEAPLSRVPLAHPISLYCKPLYTNVTQRPYPPAVQRVRLQSPLPSSSVAVAEDMGFLLLPRPRPKLGSHTAVCACTPLSPAGVFVGESPMDFSWKIRVPALHRSKVKGNHPLKIYTSPHPATLDGQAGPRPLFSRCKAPT
jgi:hypothetical protein